MTPPKWRILPAADVDIDEQVRFLARTDEALARRYLHAVHRTIQSLTRMPGMGSPVRFFRMNRSVLRKWPVVGYPAVLVFYRDLPDQIEVVRVLRARRNWWMLLEDDS